VCGADGRVPTIWTTYSRESRNDIEALQQRREAGVTIKRIADDLEISEGFFRNWERQSEAEAGRKPSTTAVESAEMRELRNSNRLFR